jgi:hypothetical protein
LARQASRIFQTNHTFVNLHPEDFLGLMYETNDLLAQPVSSEGEPGQVAVAKYIAGHEGEAIHFFTIGTGADTLHGLAAARKINVIQKVRVIPGAGLMLGAMAKFFSSQSTKRHGLQQISGALREMDDPDSFRVPTNTIATYTDMDVARRCFGDDAIRQALRYRRSLETLYLDSPSYIEKVHMIDFLTDAYENAVINNLIYLAYGREHIAPFLDEDFIRISLAFPPEVRCLDGHEIKPLLRCILEQNSASDVTRKPKGYSVFSEDLFDWMKTGFLRDLIRDIDRPDFVSQAEIDLLLDELLYPAMSDPRDPRGWFLWNLLSFDVFQKRIVRETTA